jgi:hypothetical protein
MKTNINNIKVLKESGLTMKTILSLNPNQIKTLTKKIQESSDDSQEIAALYSKKAELEANIENIEANEVIDTDKMGNPDVTFDADGKDEKLIVDGEETMQEVYTEKQRKWACWQASLSADERVDSLSHKEAVEMCKDTELSKESKKENLDNIIEGIVKRKNSYRHLTKAEFKQTVLESISELQEQMTEPTPTIAPTKPKTIPGKRPGRKSPYQPKHKPKPKAEFPEELKFDSLFKQYTREDGN